MNAVVIRPVSIQDVGFLQEISRFTFLETFASGNTEENMRQYLEESLSYDQLLSELNNPESEFYFALLDGQVIGYLKLNYGSAQTEHHNPYAVEIERIYILREFHGKQAGQLLFEKALEMAQNRKADEIWLGVWEENPRAINFYKKNGFVEFDKHIFRLGDDEQTDIMMRLKLKK